MADKAAIRLLYPNRAPAALMEYMEACDTLYDDHSLATVDVIT